METYQGAAVTLFLRTIWIVIIIFIVFGGPNIIIRRIFLFLFFVIIFLFVFLFRLLYRFVFLVLPCFLPFLPSFLVNIFAPCGGFMCAGFDYLGVRWSCDALAYVLKQNKKYWWFTRQNRQQQGQSSRRPCPKRLNISVQALRHHCPVEFMIN